MNSSRAQLTHDQALLTFSTEQLCFLPYQYWDVRKQGVFILQTSNPFPELAENLYEHWVECTFIKKSLNKWSHPRELNVFACGTIWKLTQSQPHLNSYFKNLIACLSRHTGLTTGEGNQTCFCFSPVEMGAIIPCCFKSVM